MLRLKEIGVARILICAFMGVTGAWLALALAISGVARVKAPEAALSFLPVESVALASRADQIFFSSPQDPPAEVENLARKALANQAINAKALRVLGYVADANGDTAKAEKFIRMAAKLSRREPGAQLWLIEAAARTGSVSQTLFHYDIALRTKPETQTILYPRLLVAIEDPEIRAALKPFVRADSNWVASFLFFANSNSKNLAELVDLIVETGGLQDREIAKSQELALLGRLVNEGYFDEARKLYTHFPGAKTSRMTSPIFDSSDVDGRFGAMGWTLSDDPNVGGNFVEKNGQRQVSLFLFANSATTQTVASKLLFLGSGSYDFSTQLSALDHGGGGYLKWQLRCPSAPSIGAIWTIQSSARTMQGSFVIPPACDVQYLDLIASGGNGQTGLEATIASVTVKATKN